MQVERTQATYYTSALYPQPLTPEYINGAKPNRQPERGQTPGLLAKWHFFEPWCCQVNHWLHRHNDRRAYKLFAGFRGGHWDCTTFDQPYEGHLSYVTRKYDDDIIAQTLGGGIIGLQIGFMFGLTQTVNLSKEANIFQNATMPPNRWIPVHKATYRFRLRIMGSCMAQASTFLAAYGLVDACSSQIRQKDTWLNNILGGLASGAVLYGWFRNPYQSISAGFFFGLWMAHWRFMLAPDGTPKPAFDFDRPLWGIFGGFSTWILNQEPPPEKFIWPWHLFDSKYRL